MEAEPRGRTLGEAIMTRGRPSLGIRAKLNVGVGLVVLVSAVTFGGVYALIERATLLGEKREHLLHVASMARLSFEGRSGEALDDEIAEFDRHLSEATGAPHWIRIEDAQGRMLLGADPGPEFGAGRTDDTGLRSVLFPRTMAGEIPFGLDREGSDARLIVEESLRSLPGDLRASFVRHVGFAAVLFGLVALCTSLLAHVLVVRPVRELATATEKIGEGGTWEPFSPSVRRSDEVGALCDRFAELSRRLLALVRDERYGSAHLVALGMERGLEEPLRYAQMDLVMLQGSLSRESEEFERCESLARHLEEIVRQVDRFTRIGEHPPLASS